MIYLVTGPVGAGKSTITDILAKSFKQSVKIEVDFIRHMIIRGYIKPYPYSNEAEKQLAIAVENVFNIAKNFTKNNFKNIFIDDVAYGNILKLYFRKFSKDDFMVFLLLPKRDALRKRYLMNRGGSLEKRALELHGIFSNINDKRIYTMDSSNQTPKQTANEIIRIISNRKISKKRWNK